MKNIHIAFRAFTAAALVAASVSCGNVVRSSRSPVILVVDSVGAIRGAATAGGTATSSLTSDVFTLVTAGGTCSTTNPCPTIFQDAGVIGLHIALKDLGQPGVTVEPTSNNFVTVSRVHVSYRRTDGRNQEGVDVPYAFDTASTLTVTSTSSPQTLGFPLVRIQAKQEAPLLALRSNATFITTIADVTVYGQDLVGNTVSATGSIEITFGNMADQ